MISGKIKYHNGAKRFTYDVVGYDTSECFSMYMTSSIYDAVTFMSREDIGVDDADDLWERGVTISLVKVTVQTNSRLNEKGKNVKCPVNSFFFCRLASLIRYAKVNCLTRNEEGYTGLQLASGEFEASARAKYIIPFPGTEDTVAEVVLEYGNIISLELHTDDFDISLDTDKGLEERVFYSIKNGWSSGFRLSEEYLGFPVPKPELPLMSSNDGLYHTVEEVVASHPEKDLSWLLEKDYEVVTDDTLERICNYILGYDGYVFFDTETTGLRINFLSRVGQADQCVGIILSVKYGESFFFPMQMKYMENLCDGDHWYLMEHYLRPILEGKKLVVHNLSFDWKVGYIYGINSNIVHDTMAMLAVTLGNEIKDFKLGLKENTKLLLKRDALELSDLVESNEWGENDIKFWDLRGELARLYACPDTDDTHGVFQYCMQNDLLGKYNANKVYEIEIAFAYAVGYQEFYGHHIDVENIDSLRESLHKDQASTYKDMVDMIGHEFNPNSSPQLQRIMYKELGIPEQISRKTGRPTTDSDTLKRLSELTDIEDNTKYPFCVKMKKYREYEGVRKIVDKFPETMTTDGYVFSDVMQYGTTTGRVSVKAPNYQSYNNPVKMRVIPRPGFYMTDTDYSSVEYRVLANMVGNKRIMHSFEDPDFDYHTYQAAHMYSVPYSAVTKTLRKAAKGINFGLPYGMGDESLGVRIFGEETPQNTLKAASLRSAYFKGQEDIRDWFEFHRDKGVNLGYTETYFNRRRYYRRSDFSVNAIRRQAGNQVVQGCIQGDVLLQEMVQGFVKIKNLVDQWVNVWDGYEWTSGLVTYSGKKQKCIVKFKGGQSIICSPIHKFLVRSNKGNERFVDCKDLLTLETTKNAHRVVINECYIPSENKYSSDDARKKFSSSYCNANNFFIDDLECDSFKKGVVLGRIASDGNYPYDPDSNERRVMSLVAEHEYCIIDDLVSYMSGWDICINEPGVRDGRNEAITYLNTHSLSLCKELRELDIRHGIDDKIFADTEMLRGFICGFFDGDGGVSGKTITLVQGVQYDFEPMFLDIQRALLCLGIRSRYRKYKDRYVLAIKTTDNERFLDRIGFLNQQKQELGYELECKEDEHVFGKCLLVESVEITDEYIDMYDVVNTERGYYMADGMITHNTAADIYKLAVGRVFKRICREGWLGKVLLPGFIHDELLAEVSNDINPAVWLKALREEFEVKVFNDDGSQWCPLYMGFGYGMSWYEAKSVELPIRLQQEIVDSYGVSGFPDWDGDGRKFFDKIPDMLRDYSVRDIRNQLLDEESQGKEIKPALNSALIDCIKDDVKMYEEGISNYIQESGDFVMIQSDGMQEGEYLSLVEGALCEYLDKHYHIQSLYKVDGVPVSKFEALSDTQQMLDQFCMLHNTDRSKINLLNIEEYDSSSSSVLSGEVEYEDDSELSSEEKLQRIKDTRIDTLGLYLDTDKMEVTLLAVPPNYMTFIQQRVNRDERGYRVMFKDSNGVLNPNLIGGLYRTESFLTSEMVNTIQNMYLQYFNSLK